MKLAADDNICYIVIIKNLHVFRQTRVKLLQHPNVVLRLRPVTTPRNVSEPAIWCGNVWIVDEKARKITRTNQRHVTHGESRANGPDGCEMRPQQWETLASFSKEVNPRLAKRPLVCDGRLANRGLTSSVKRPQESRRRECYPAELKTGFVWDMVPCGRVISI